MPLTPSQKERYDRNVRVRGIGETGQERLLSSRVLVIGAGGLGSSAILYLAAAGVGTLGIADDDTVSLGNLQRQVLYRAADEGRPKVGAAQDRIGQLNADVDVLTYQHRVDAENIVGLVSAYDFVVECTDDSRTKFLVNDACVLAEKPFCHAGVLALQGQVMSYVPGHACLRCAFEEPIASAAPTSSDVGILGAAAGVLGAMQAAEAVKYITGCGTPILDGFLRLDLKHGTAKRVRVRRDKRCPGCGRSRSR